MSSGFLVAVIATGTSILTVVEILVALWVTVDKDVNSNCWQDFSTSESYGHREKKVSDSPERRILNVADPYFLQCGGPTREGE